MSAQSRAAWRLTALLDLAFPALTIVFGLQLMRVMIPAIVYVYGEQQATSSIDIGVFALVAFLLAFLSPLLPRFLGLRRALWGTAGGVALLRLTLQLVADPNVRLWIATVGVLIFLFYVPITIGYSRGAQRAPNFGLAFLTGFAFDTALHGAWRTYDYAWIVGAGPITLTLALTLAQVWLLWRFMTVAEPATQSDGQFVAALPLVGFGAALFLQAILWQNIARHAATLGWPLPAAFLLVTAGNAVALAAAVIVQAGSLRTEWAVTLIAIAGLLVAAFAAQGGSAPGLILADAAMAVLLVQTGRGQTGSGARTGLVRTSTAWSLGTFLFVILSLFYYISYDINLPFENTILPPVAAALLGLAAIGAMLARRESKRVAVDWTPAVFGATLLVLSLAAWVSETQPEPVAGDGLPARVMSYNIHHGGFDAGGWLGMEAIAQTIEETGAEVIALQEVSRGWYINASIDSLEWLSQRLNMPYVYAGAADAIWGNAILSRNPILASGHAELPRGGVPLRRGYLWAEIDVGNGETIVVIDTHLHHTGDEKGEQVRLLQFPAVIDAWGGRDSAVIMGDLNAGPASPVLDLARSAGLLDAFELAGSGDGFTFRSDNPFQRIDYILLSPDWSASDFRIPDRTASDHLGITVTIDK